MVESSWNIIFSRRIEEYIEGPYPVDLGNDLPRIATKRYG